MIKRLMTIAETTNDRKIAFILFFIALILRTGYAIFSYFNFPLMETNLYYELAQEIIQQGKIFYDKVNSYYEISGPVIPWLNALTMLVFGKNYLGLYIVTALGSALIVLFIYKTARLFLDKKTSLFAGVWAMFYLFYFYYISSPGKDIWMAFFMIFLLYLLIKLFIKHEFNYKNYLLFIFIYVISFHLDERYVIFGPFILLFILYNETFAFKKLRIKKSLLFIIFVILLMIPWSVRHYQKYDRVIILTPRTQPYTDKIFGYEPKDEYFGDDFMDIKGRYYIHDYQIDSVINGTKTHTDAGYEIPKDWIEAMREGKRPAPLTGLEAYWSRIRTMMEPFQIEGRFERTGYYYYEKSFRHNVATFLFYGIIFLFSIPGFYFLYLKNRQIFFLFLGTIVIYVTLHALTIPYTNWRYRLPLDAIFIIVGWIGITSILKKIKFFKG
ncbi:MAG: ArnT family glycosyltransferase [Thiohalospira sp.]